MFAARTRGTSMEPPIEHGKWAIFASRRIGTRKDHIVLVEDRSKIGEDRYTLKKYHSTKSISEMAGGNTRQSCCFP